MDRGWTFGQKIGGGLIIMIALSAFMATIATRSLEDIRALIDDVRAAVNATVMTTEGGSKAVDAGARQFEHMAASLTQLSRGLLRLVQAQAAA
jgi:hypothetical protein